MVTNGRDRKRAKTEDEKEQRRVERVLRNRRAAQSSRERKRLEVEALEEEKRIIEREKDDLRRRLDVMEARNRALQAQLDNMTQGGARPVFRGVSPTTSDLNAPSAVDFSHGLFSPRVSGSDDRIASPPTSSLKTVNPASLSPEPTSEDARQSSNATISDLTQHPAAMLCDLPCQSELPCQPWTTLLPTSSSPSPLAPPFLLSLLVLILPTISRILSPLYLPLRSIRDSSPLPLSPSPLLLSTIISLVTTPASSSPLMQLLVSQIPTPSWTSTWPISSRTLTSSRPLPRSPVNLRLNLLRQFLASSPHVARPLLDATMRALRSVATSELVDVSMVTDGSRGPVYCVDGPGQTADWATLMSLACALRQFLAEHRREGDRQFKVRATASRKQRRRIHTANGKHEYANGPQGEVLEAHSSE